MTNPGLTDLVAFWSMDEISGTRYDKTGLAGDLTDLNTVGSTKVGVRRSAANFIAAFNEALRLMNNSYINMGGNISFTIGMWIQPHAMPTTSQPLAKWTDGSGDREYQIFLNGSNEAMFIVNDGSTNYSVPATTFGAMTNGIWYFVCAYFNASANLIGVGVNDVWDTAAGPSAGVANKGNPLYFARSSSDIMYFDGRIDETFIYKDRLLTADQRTWMYNSGYGRTYEDVAELQPPYIVIDSDYTIGDLPVHVFGTDLKRIGMIENYYSLSWAERYNEVGDFELELPIEWELRSEIDFGNFLYIKSSDKFMIIEDQKVSIAEDKTSLLITGKSIEGLLKLRGLDEPINVDNRAEITIYDLILDNIKAPTDPNRELTLFADGLTFPAMLTEPVFKEQFKTQTIYDIVSTIAKGSSLGFKIVCSDLDASSPAFTFYVYEGIDRSYDNPDDNTFIVFSEKFQNILNASFYSSEEGKVTVVLVLTDDVVHDKVYVWEEGAAEPTDMDRIEKTLETTIDRDAVSPSLTDAEVLAIIQTRGRELIKESGPIGILDGDFDVYFDYSKYGVDFFMGDIVQCNIQGADVSARVIELVRSYSMDGEKTYLGLDFIMS